jgi:hypothetical protein
MQLAGLIKIGKLHQKDKRPENNRLIPAEDTTHGSDAVDTLIVGINKHKVGYAMQSSSLIMG